MFKLYSPGPVPVPEFCTGCIITKLSFTTEVGSLRTFISGFLERLSYIFQTEHPGLCMYGKWDLWSGNGYL